MANWKWRGESFAEGYDALTKPNLMRNHAGEPSWLRTNGEGE